MFKRLGCCSGSECVVSYLGALGLGVSDFGPGKLDAEAYGEVPAAWNLRTKQGNPNPTRPYTPKTLCQALNMQNPYTLSPPTTQTMCLTLVLCSADHRWWQAADRLCRFQSLLQEGSSGSGLRGVAIGVQEFRLTVLAFREVWGLRTFWYSALGLESLRTPSAPLLDPKPQALEALNPKSLRPRGSSPSTNPQAPKPLKS